MREFNEEGVASSGERTRVGILAMPWAGVPARCIGSLSLVAHHISRPLIADFDLTLIGGKGGRDPTQELPGIRYHAISDRMDRRLFRRWSDWRESRRDNHRHPFYRETYHPFYAARAAKAFQRAGCDVVLVFQFPQWLSAMRRRLPNAKVLLWAQAATMIEESGPIRKQIAEADGVVACSRYIAQRIETLVPSLRGRSDVVYNGFDPSIFYPEKKRQHKTKSLLYVGRITPEKGVHVLVDAFRHLAAERDDLELTLVGPVGRGDVSMLCGTDPEHLKQIARFSGDYSARLLELAGNVASRIRFTGPLPQSELGKLYRKADVFIHPGLWEEPFGMPVVEAAACGVPVIATRRGGVPELIHEGRTGRLVPSGDSLTMSQAIQEVLDNPYWHDTARIAEYASQRFQWESSAQSLRSLLRARYMNNSIGVRTAAA